MNCLPLGVIVLLSVFHPVLVYNILVTIPYTGKSHYLLLQPLAAELARRGHNVTILTAYEEKHPPPNYTEIVFEKPPPWNLQNGKDVTYEMQKVSLMENLHLLHESSLKSTENVLKSINVAKFIWDNSSHFDVVISNLWNEDALYMLAHKYRAPLVLFSSYGDCPKSKVSMRIPIELSQTAHLLTKFVPPFSFIEKIQNMYIIMYELVMRKYSFMPRQEELVRKYFPKLPEPVPSLEDLVSNADLLLLNSHFSVDRPHNYPPRVVEVGGLQLNRVDTTLPKDLQLLLDQATNGVLYVSFGTNMRSSRMPTSQKQMFIEVFRKLNQTVLWKFEDLEIDSKPENLYISEWFPQKSILAHHNVKAFLTHGGLLSSHEAIFFGVPVIGMPFFGDQWRNIIKAENGGYGKLIEFNKLNITYLLSAINEVIYERRYAKSAKKYSERFRDRPLDAMETAVYWIEYIVRHKGASFLRSSTTNLSWFSYYMIDISMAVVITLCMVLYTSKGILGYLRNTFSDSTKERAKLKIR